MRPTKLIFSGLHCFENEQIVDFDLLSMKGIFGIFGPTGSGKSTILDAITLALYGKVNRSKLKTDFVNTKTKKTVVKLEFVANVNNKQKTFVVERVIKIKKNGIDIDHDATLFEGSHVVAEKVANVDIAIRKIVGLGLNEFSKCIALPQGEFAAFLKAKPTERIELVGNIFDLEEFGDPIWSKTKKLSDELLGEINVLKSKKEMLSSVSADEISEKENNIEKTKQEIEKLELEISELSKDLDKKSSVLLKQKRFSELQSQKQKHAQNEEQIENQKILLSKFLSVKQNAKTIERNALLESKISKLRVEIFENQKEIDSKSFELREKQKTFKTLQKIFEDSIQNISEIEKLEKLKTEQSKLEEFKQEKLLLEKQIEELAKNRIEIVERQKLIAAQISEKNADLLKLQEERKCLLEDENSLKEGLKTFELSKKQEVLMAFENDLMNAFEKLKENEKTFFEQLKENKIKIESEDAKTQKLVEKVNHFFVDDKTNMERIRESEQKLFKIQEAEDRISFFKSRIKILDQENEVFRNEIYGLENQIPKIRQKIENSERLIFKNEENLMNELNEREMALKTSITNEIAASLKPGEICPVCFSNVKNTRQALGADLAGFDHNIGIIKLQGKSLQLERQSHAVNLAVVQFQIEKLNEKILQNSKQKAEFEKQIDQIFIKFVDITKNKEEDFENLKIAVKDSIETIEKIFKIQSALVERMQTLKDEKIEIGTKISVLIEMEEKLQKMLSKIRAEIAECEFKILQASSENKKFEIDLEIDKTQKEISLINDQIDELLQSKETIVDQENKLEILLNNVCNDFENKTSVLKIVVEKIEKIQTDILNSTRGFNSIEHKIKSLLSARENAVLEKEGTAKQIEELTMFVTNLEKLNESKKAQLFESTKTSKELSKDLADLFVKHKFADVENALEFLISDEKIEKMQKTIEEYETEKALIEKEIIQLKKEGVDGNQPFENIFEIQTNVEGKTKRIMNIRESLGELNATLGNAKEDLLKSQEIEMHLNVLTKKLDNVIELSSVLKSKALVEWVAEEYIQDITKIATSKLLYLLDGRYSLVFENKEFLVADNFDEGKMRSASTLSGGETFVVSLSLALAISESILKMSNRHFDFFFLDEGFGSLDKDLRIAVMESLSKLEESGIKIGVISHIMELQNDIKNRIIVEKIVNKKDGTVSSRLRVEQGL